MVVKLITIIALARWLDIEDFALFGLFTATIGLSVYLLGLDFYTYSLREFIAAGTAQRGWIVKQHFVAMAVSATCILPLIAVSQIGLPVGVTLLGWLLVILLIEHIGQELVRVLTAAGAQVQASVLHFCRTAVWGPPLLWLFATNSDAIGIDSVFIAWGIGGLASLAYGFFAIKKLELQGWTIPVEKAWIVPGFRIAAPLFLATAAMRLLFTLDRYLIEWFGDSGQLAAYTLYMTLAGGLIGLADAAFNAFAYPQLVAASRRGDRDAFLKEFRQFFMFVSAFSAVSAILVQLLLPLVLHLLPEPAYRQHAYLLPWILAAVSTYLVSTVFHYGLFARDQDQSILIANVAALGVFPVSYLCFDYLAILSKVPMAMLAAFVAMLCLKALALHRNGGMRAVVVTEEDSH